MTDPMPMRTIFIFVRYCINSNAYQIFRKLFTSCSKSLWGRARKTGPDRNEYAGGQLLLFNRRETFYHICVNQCLANTLNNISLANY